MGLWEQVQSRDSKVTKGLGQLCREGGLREVGVFTLGKRRLWGHLTESL